MRYPTKAMAGDEIVPPTVGIAAVSGIFATQSDVDRAYNDAMMRQVQDLGGMVFPTGINRRGSTGF